MDEERESHIVWFELTKDFKEILREDENFATGSFESRPYFTAVCDLRVTEVCECSRGGSFVHGKCA
jgi:hypothetical protein